MTKSDATIGSFSNIHDIVADPMDESSKYTINSSTKKLISKLLADERDLIHAT